MKTSKKNLDIKKGDYVICIDNSNSENLTLNKIYEVCDIENDRGDSFVRVIEDRSSRPGGYYIWRFKKVNKEWAKILYGNV